MNSNEMRIIAPQFKEVPDSIFSDHDTPIGRDLKQNLIDLLDKSSLSAEEAGLVLLAVSTSVGLDALAHYARERVALLKISLEQMQEAAESAALMAMLNVYYSFRRVIDDPQYGTPRLRMSVLMAPKVGQLRFDMIAFSLSVLNGCESCIQGHEESLKEAGVSLEKVHDLARLAAVVKGLALLRMA